jgi:outer membrane biosynthesis protein TonB
MDRTTTVFAGFLLALFAFGQESQPGPQTPEDAFVMQQPVAWTRMQKPQPAPQPLPPQDTTVPEPDQQGKQPENPQTPSQQTPVTQSFTGKIVKDGDKYVLKVASNTSYELQGDVKQYENQNVRVTGKLDSVTNTILVAKIELLS